jgi:hypothetical protein
MHIQTSEDAGHMGIDGAAADEEGFADLAVGFAFSQQKEHLALSRGQSGCGSRGVPICLFEPLSRGDDGFGFD